MNFNCTNGFKSLTPELDALIEEIHMEITAECDNLDKLEAEEQRCQGIEDYLDTRIHRIRDFRKELTLKQRGMIKEIKGKLVGANKVAEDAKRVIVNHGTINYHE